MKIFKAEPSHWYRFGDEQLGLVDRIFVKRKRQEPGFYRRMFEEDFARLFRSINRRSNDLFKIVSNDDDLMQKILGNVKTRYAPHSIDETIHKLVEEIAQSLIWFGRSHYFLYDETELNEIQVVPFSSDGVMRFFGLHIQWVPNYWERHWNQEGEKIPREIRILDASKVMCFYMPKSIKRMLTKQNKTLAVLDQHQFELRNFYPMVTYENPNPVNHFDFRVWNDIQKCALYRATRGTGWHCREHDLSKLSDFFYYHRMICFRRNQLLLRDDILNQLSAELSRVGKGYKEDFSVEISGTDELPNIAELNELKRKLASEEVGFNEISDYCYKR